MLDWLVDEAAGPIVDSSCASGMAACIGSTAAESDCNEIVGGAVSADFSGCAGDTVLDWLAFAAACSKVDISCACGISGCADSAPAFWLCPSTLESDFAGIVVGAVSLTFPCRSVDVVPDWLVFEAVCPEADTFWVGGIGAEVSVIGCSLGLVISVVDVLALTVCPAAGSPLIFVASFIAVEASDCCPAVRGLSFGFTAESVVMAASAGCCTAMESRLCFSGSVAAKVKSEDVAAAGPSFRFTESSIAVPAFNSCVILESTLEFAGFSIATAVPEDVGAVDSPFQLCRTL